MSNTHALPGATNHERKGQHIVLSYKQIRAVGSYGTPKWEDPIVGDLLKRRWSWQSLCTMTEEEHKWWAKEFIEAYRVMAEQKTACPQIETNIKIKGLVKDIGGIDETKKRLRRAV